MKKIPNSFTILLCLILLACALTWIIPGGSYPRETGADGVVRIRADELAYTENTPVNPLSLPSCIVEGFVKNVDLILVLLFSGGAFSIVNASGALQSLIRVLAAKCQRRRVLLLVLLTTAFALICSNQALQLFIPFVPILAMLAISMGYDSLTGAAMLILGGGIGFSTGTLRTTTTLVAQQIAGLPLYSGLWYRAVCLVVFLIPTCMVLCLYARKVQKDPCQSPMFDLDHEMRVRAQQEKDLKASITGPQWRVLLVLAFALTLMIYGTLRYGWGVRQLAAVFLALGIAVGILERHSADQIASLFLKGSSGMLSAAFLVGFGTAISQVLSAGGITDTIIHGLSQAMAVMPRWSQGACMYLANTVVNMFISSATALASVVMPIFVPVADNLDITRQTAVLAYNFGDGLSNYILPTSSALMGILGAAGIPYNRWLKFMGKVFLLWSLLACLMVTIAQYIHLGPM